MERINGNTDAGNSEPALLEKFERIVLAEAKIRLLTSPSAVRE